MEAKRSGKLINYAETNVVAIIDFDRQVNDETMAISMKSVNALRFNGELKTTCTIDAKLCTGQEEEITNFGGARFPVPQLSLCLTSDNYQTLGCDIMSIQRLTLTTTDGLEQRLIGGDSVLGSDFVELSDCLLYSS